MVTHELVPELMLAPAGEKLLLPEAAEGGVEVWQGNDGFEAYGYFRLSDPARNALMLDRYMRLASLATTFEVRYRPGLGKISLVLDEVEARVLAGLS